MWAIERLRWRGAKPPPHKLRVKRQLDNKVAVSPSRPLICSPPPSFYAERSTPQTVKFILTTPSLPSRSFEFTPNGEKSLSPKFACFQRQVGDAHLIRFSNRINQSKISVLPPRGGELLINSNTIDNMLKIRLLSADLSQTQLLSFSNDKMRRNLTHFLKIILQMSFCADKQARFSGKIKVKRRGVGKGVKNEKGLCKSESFEIELYKLLFFAW